MKTSKSLIFDKNYKWNKLGPATQSALKELLRLETKGKLTDQEKLTMKGIMISNYGLSTSLIPEEIRKEIESKYKKSEIPRIRWLNGKKFSMESMS